MSLNEQLRRRRGVRNLEKRFLIVCEDDKSACHYFEALKRRYLLSATSIEIVGSGGRTQPLQVVERAVHRKSEAANKDSGTLPFDSVWCLIDGDYGNKIANARSKAKAQGVKIAVSTKCFEYWILLHFEETEQTRDCNAVIHALKKKYLPMYDKGKCDFLPVVVNLHKARRRAKGIRERGIQRGESLPEQQNPCSEVYALIEELGIPEDP